MLLVVVVRYCGCVVDVNGCLWLLSVSMPVMSFSCGCCGLLMLVGDCRYVCCWLLLLEFFQLTVWLVAVCCCGWFL